MRLIDADVLEEAGWWLIRDNRNQYVARTYETKGLDDIPTIDAVSVVRCRECEYGIQVDGGIKCDACNNWFGFVSWNEDDWFCAGGKRREVDHDGE